MQTTDFYSSATGTLQVKGGRDKNAPKGVSLSIDDLSYIKQGSRANEGSAGTTDYNDLTNKPLINNVELKGNKSLNDLGIQPKIDSSHKVSADNIDDTGTTNKFATTAQLAQIQTNENNILYNSNTGVKNVLKNDITTVTLGGVTGTTNSDGSITLSSSGTVSNTFVLDTLSTLPVNNYNGISKNTAYKLKGTGSDKVGVQVGDLDTEEGTFNLIATASTTDVTYMLSRNYVRYRILIYSGADFTAPVTIYPLSTLATHDTNYVPYAPSNAELYAMIKALQS